MNAAESEATAHSAPSVALRCLCAQTLRGGCARPAQTLPAPGRSRARLQQGPGQPGSLTPCRPTTRCRAQPCRLGPWQRALAGHPLRQCRCCHPRPKPTTEHVIPCCLSLWPWRRWCWLERWRLPLARACLAATLLPPTCAPGRSTNSPRTTMPCGCPRSQPGKPRG